MYCPACTESMTTYKSSSIETERCHSCGGLWLDWNELNVFVRMGKIPASTIARFQSNAQAKIIEEGKRKCPRCDICMKVINHRGINVDYCDRCGGFWFDRGELLQILRKYQAESEKEQRLEVKDNEFPVDRETETGLYYVEKQIESGKPDPLEVELLSGGTIDDVARAIPEKIPSSENEFSTSPLFSDEKVLGKQDGKILGLAVPFDVNDAVDTVGIGIIEIIGEILMEMIEDCFSD